MSILFLCVLGRLEWTEIRRFPPHFLCSTTQHFQKEKMFVLEIFQTAFCWVFKLIFSFFRILDRNSQHDVVIQTAMNHSPIPNHVTSENFLIQHYSCAPVVCTHGFSSMSLFALTKWEKPQSNLGTCKRCNVPAFSALFADISPLHRWERECKERRMTWASLMCRN